MKRMRASIALIAAGALLSPSGARAAPAAANHARWEGGRPAALSTVSAEDPSLLESPRGAAEAGDVEAMNQLGVYLLLNVKTSSDYLMAFHWFQKAADLRPSIQPAPQPEEPIRHDPHDGGTTVKSKRLQRGHSQSQRT